MESASLPEDFPLWPDKAPGTEDWSQQEQETLIPRTNLKLVRNVTQPTLTAYLPDPSVANGAAVIVCPGGGFQFYSMENEGTDVARWLNARGVAAFILKYRLIQTGSDEDFLLLFRLMFAPLAILEQSLGKEQIAEQKEKIREQRKAHAPLAVMDGRQALRVVRERAATWGVDPQRIGILGFSAGGIIAVSTATESHEADSRPNFAGSIYVGSATQNLTVPADAPPLFIALANDDPNSSDGSLSLYSGWKAAGHPVKLHIYSKGGHGFGMKKQNLPSDHWIERFGEWLHAEGLLA